MDIERLIINRLKRNGRVKTAEVVKATGFSRAYINKFFKKLKSEGAIALLGRANSAFYVPAKGKIAAQARKNITKAHRILINKDLAEDTVLGEIKKNSGIFLGITKNVTGILDYAFTEILNNAIEHSQSKKIEVIMEKDKSTLTFNVLDRGVGIFNNIMQKKGLQNPMQAIEDLLKGKQSTMPQAHSGEGIFFTSKAADLFIIQSSRKKLIFDNNIGDIFIRDIKNVRGTKVFFSVKLNAGKQLSNIFREYTDDSFEFSKTKVTVKLFKKGSEYISRSQARRILAGLDKFKTIVMDFKNIETVGQGFADEIFRVWKINHPDITIVPLNINENISFMIKRARHGY